MGCPQNVFDMGLVWVKRRNNTHTLPITRQLWVVFLEAGSYKSILRVFLFRVFTQAACILYK